MPVLVDDMQDSVAKAYNAMPDRLFVVKSDGTIGYRGDRGPRGFDVDAMARALGEIVASDKGAAGKKASASKAPKGD